MMIRSTPEDEGRISVPVLAPHLEYRNIGNQQTLLVSETFNTLLHGQLPVDILPLLDGRLQHDDIVAKLAGDYTEAAVENAIATLTKRGYVISGEYEMHRSRAAFWSSLGATPRYVERALAQSTIAVHGDDGKLTQHLNAAGVATNFDGKQLSVYLCADYLENRFAPINKDHLKRKSPWLLVRPLGVQSMFGPVFSGRAAGPCWDCLCNRLRNHQEVHNFLRNSAGEIGAFVPHASESTSLEAIYRLVATEILKWLVIGETAAIQAHAVTINTGSLECVKHLVTKQPQCRSCGDKDLSRPDRSPKPLRLHASPKLHLNSSGSRTVEPSATLAKYRHLVSPISGVVTFLSRTTDSSDPWLHVYWAGANLSNRSSSFSSLRRSLRSKSAGKGATREQAEASALCEAIERYSGAFHGDEVRITTTFNKLADDSQAIHPNAIQLFSENQLDHAQRMNAEGHPYNVVPQRFDVDAEVDWTPVWSLTENRHKYVPTSMLFSLPPEIRRDSDLFADSNGCAAGNTLAEAILQGFYELVERDAFAIWWYNQLRAPKLNLESFDDAFLNVASKRYDAYDRELWLLDITSDLEIPVIVAVSRRLNADSEDIIYGAGAHANPRIAAVRAVCELNQCLTWLPQPGKEAGKPTIDDPLALRWWQTSKLQDCEWLKPNNGVTRSAAEFTVIEYDDTRDDISHCRELVEAKGLEFLVLDQTRPDVKMPVVRVLVPGLRHFWARFAAGRIYEVPVSMGLRQKPCEESELNPVPVIV
ncbi:MAG: TOMM precursor leader peptide-binding protein [Gammaproteobacteria bacterium]|nr:TOMM precursor leader peptide-binding protein [Gammaproteobacteria bacterium]